MKKGFTLVELLGVIVIIAILAGLAIVSISTIINNSTRSVYKNYESNLESAAKHYLINNPDKTPTKTNPLTISFTELKNLDLIDDLEDPNGGDCQDSSVTITREEDTGINMNFSYKVCLICTNYRNEGC